jgi:hypothetical protein
MTLAERFLSDFEPYLDDDDGTLPMFTTAVTSPLEDLETIAQPDDQGVGFSSLLDPDRAPADYLEWLGQAVGTAIARGTAEDVARDAIKHPAGWRTGTVASIIAAVQPTLVPVDPSIPATVIVLERTSGGWSSTDNPWHLTVATFTDETPDAAAATVAALSQKDIGNIMNVVQIAHWVYLTVLTSRTTYADVVSHFATYNALAAG